MMKANRRKILQCLETISDICLMGKTIGSSISKTFYHSKALSPCDLKPEIFLHDTNLLALSFCASLTSSISVFHQVLMGYLSLLMLKVTLLSLLSVLTGSEMETILNAF